MTIQEVVKRTADSLTQAVRDSECNSFNEMRSLYDWDAQDIRNEIDYIARDILNKDYDEWSYENRYNDSARYHSVFLGDDTSLQDDNSSITYREFKRLVISYVNEAMKGGE